MKGHFAVDSRRKLIHAVVATPANVADSTVLPDLLHGNETRVWGDQAYRGQRAVIRQHAPRARDFVNRRYRHHGCGGRGRAGEKPEQIAVTAVSTTHLYTATVVNSSGESAESQAVKAATQPEAVSAPLTLHYEEGRITGPQYRQLGQEYGHYNTIYALPV